MLDTRPPLDDESPFRDLAQAIGDVFYTREAATAGLLYVSPAYEKVWGQDLDCLRHDPLAYLDAIHSDDRAAVDQAHRDNCAGKASETEYRVLRAGGGHRWVRDIAYPVTAAREGGAIFRIVGSARDITDRKNAHQELARAHRALQLLSRCNTAITQLASEESLLADVCRLAVEVGGYRMAWIGYAGMDEDRAVVPVAHHGHEEGYLSTLQMSWRDDHPSGQGSAGRAIRTGHVQQVRDFAELGVHFLWRGPALQRGYHSAIFLPLRAGTATFGLLAMYSPKARCIGDDEVALLRELADNVAFAIEGWRARQAHKKSQNEARRALEKVREQASLLDKARDAIVVRDLEHRVLYWNQGAERLYQWTAAEVMGRSVLTLMAERQGFHAAMRELLAQGEWQGELDAVAKDGTPRIVECHWTLVKDDEGRPKSVLSINTDIRERKRAQEDLLQANASLEERVQRRTAELECANQQLEAFSYSVSHDLRSPLSAIDGFSRLLGGALGKEIEGGSSSRSHHYLSRIRTGIRQMGDLIEAMLSLSQVARGGLQIGQADLTAMAEELLESYREHEPARPCQFEVEAGLMVRGDGRLLRQVLDNLLGNAWKFSAKSALTHITVRLCSELVEDGPGGRQAVYAVSDRGAGFDMAQAEGIFNVFQRLHSDDDFPGSGVGLATVHRIIARHGGRIWVKAAPGEGAAFYFTLGAANP